MNVQKISKSLDDNEMNKKIEEDMNQDNKNPFVIEINDEELKQNKGLDLSGDLSNVFNLEGEDYSHNYKKKKVRGGSH